MPAPPATVDARNPKGDRSGPPGVGLDVSGTGYLGCRNVYVFFDGTRVGTLQPDASGAITGGGLSVPGDSAPGQHVVTTSCAPSGDAVRATASFLVTDAAVHRSAFVTALPEPDQISFNARALATSAIAAVAFILLFAFPYELFNSTVEENYDEIRHWFRLPARAVAATAHGRRRTVGFFVLNLLAAIACGFLSPDFGWNRNSGVLLVGMFAALLVMSVVFSLPASIAIYRRFGERGTLNFLPGSLLVSIVMVVISRALDFRPGYFYGAMAGLAFTSALSEDSVGRVTAANWAFSLIVSIGAFLARAPVADAAAQPGASVWWIGLEACLVLIFLWGIESLAVAMLPMRFLDGKKVITWNRVAWSVLFFLGVFATVHVLFSPNSGYVGQTAAGVRIAVAVLFLVFGAISVGLWAYFRYRPQRWAPPPA